MRKPRVHVGWVGLAPGGSAGTCWRSRAWGRTRGGATTRQARTHEGSSKPPPPIKEGEEFSVKIEGVGSSGDGLVRVKGFIVFVPGTKVGEEVRVRVTKVARSVGFAEKVQ